MLELHRVGVEEYKKVEKLPVTVVLDNVRSEMNVGSVFRTADAFLIERICLCGITPQPPKAEIHKTALGAEESVAWQYYPTTLAAVEQLKAEGNDWLADTHIWLYRGAWMEWELGRVDMAVPLSPDEVVKKRHAIFRHLSQKDIVPFPGEDPREFWQRAEERTQNTARLYDQLGMAEYQAIEVFLKLC